jgi:integrase
MSKALSRPTRRRQRGTGSIRRLSDGKYQIIYDLPTTLPSSPRRQRYVIVTGTKRDAEKQLRSLQDEASNGSVVEDDRLTVNILCDRYLEAKAISRELTTVEWYTRLFAQHVRPKIGVMRVRDLRASNVQSLLATARNQSRTKMNGARLGSSSVRNIRISIRALLAWAVKQGYVNRNVADSVETPNATQIVERKAMELEDVRTLLQACQASELEAVVPFAIGTGLRRSEICALRWSDLDLDRGTIRVQRAAANVTLETLDVDGVARKERAVIVKGTKTRRSARVDYLAPFVVAILRRQRAEQARRHDRIGTFRLGDDMLVFDRFDGRAWDPNEMSRAFSRLIRKHQVTPLRFHDLRHAYATFAFAAGVPLKAVSDSLGHSSIGVTSAIYVHLLDQTKLDKADRLQEYLGEAVGAPSKR